MPEGTRSFMHDRGMSLHRRAYDCRSEDEWLELAPRLGITDRSTIDQIWRTARKAHMAGMSKEQAFPLTVEIDRLRQEGLAAVLVQFYLGETVVTNDRVLNDVLRHAGDIIGRRDVSPMDKFETLFAYLVKARREALGAVDI